MKKFDNYKSNLAVPVRVREQDLSNEFFLRRVIPVSSDMGYTRKKGNSLYRGYNPAMKNKRSYTPKVCWMQHGSGSTCFACA